MARRCSAPASSCGCRRRRPKQTFVGRPTLRPLSSLFYRRFLSENRVALFRNLLRAVHTSPGRFGPLYTGAAEEYNKSFRLSAMKHEARLLRYDGNTG